MTQYKVQIGPLVYPTVFMVGSLALIFIIPWMAGPPQPEPYGKPAPRWRLFGKKPEPWEEDAPPVSR